MKKVFAIILLILLLFPIVFKAPEITSANAVMDTGEVTATSLNVREKPSTSSRVIAGLRKGAKIDLYEKSGSWYKTKLNGRFGYVHSDYIKVSNVAAGSGQVTASNLNVRQNATTNSRIIGSLRQGTKVDYYEKTGSWYKIKVNGNWGYIHGDYFKVTTSGSTGADSGSGGNSSNESSTVEGQGEVTASNLNVRQNANTSARIIGSLRQGTKVDYYEKTGSWYKIKVNGNWGYIHGDYFKVTTSSSTGADSGSGGNSSNDSSIVEGQGEVTASNLNVRQNANTSSRIIGSLRQGTKVDYYEKTGSWYKIKVNGNWGYIHGDYFKVTTSGSTGADSGSEGNSSNDNGTVQGRGEVTASNLNVRQNANTSARIIGSLRQGTKVDYYKKTGSWYKIKVNGNWGYIHGDYVKIIQQENLDDAPSEIGRVTATRLNVREKASTNSSVIGSLTQGTQIQLEEKSGSWYKITLNNKTGYVHRDYIQVVQPIIGEENGNDGSPPVDPEEPESSETPEAPIGPLVHLAGKTIFLDPGHGGYDPGAVVNGVEEKELTLTISQKLKQSLEDAGAKVVMSRSDDTFVQLGERVRLANNSGVDLFISIHMNSWTGAAPSGVEVFYDLVNEGSNSRRLAEEVQRQLVNDLGFRDRGAKERNLEVIRFTKMPSILAELGFMSNSSDLHVLQNEQDKIVNAICVALNRYFE